MEVPAASDVEGEGVRSASPVPYKQKYYTKKCSEMECKGKHLERVKNYGSAMLGTVVCRGVPFEVEIARCQGERRDVIVKITCNPNATDPYWRCSFSAVVKCTVTSEVKSFGGATLALDARKNNNVISSSIWGWALSPLSRNPSSIMLKIEIEMTSWDGIYLPLHYDCSIRTDISDATLVVEGTRLYVSRSMLAFSSNYFYNLFFSNKKDVDEFVLDDISLSDISLYLDVTYAHIGGGGRKDFINSANQIEGLLTLALKLESNTLTRLVEQILCDAPLSNARVLLIADKFNLSGTCSRVLSRLCTWDDVHAVMVEDSYEELSDPAKAVILDAVKKNSSLIDFSDEDDDDTAVPTTSGASETTASAGESERKRRRD